MKEHPHEFTQYSLPSKDDLKIDPNFTNVLKNVRDQIGSLNANIQNFTESNNRGSKVITWLTIILAVAAAIQAYASYQQYKISQQTLEFQERILIQQNEN